MGTNLHRTRHITTTRRNAAELRLRFSKARTSAVGHLDRRLRKNASTSRVFVPVQGHRGSEVVEDHDSEFRRLNDGDELTPTVLVGEQVLRNPSADELVDSLSD